MKTAIVKTHFWDNMEFGELHLDSRMFYFYLLTNPSRGLADIFYINIKVAQAHTGLDKTVIENAIKQLENLKMIKHKNGYFRLLTNVVEPKRGRFTQSAIEKELSEIPKDVFEYLSQENEEKNTGTLPVHIYINKNIDNNINKDKDINNNKTVNKDVDNLLKLWKTKIGYEIKSNIGQNISAIEELLKIYTIEELESLIECVIYSSKDKYAPVISDFATMLYKINQFNAWIKKSNLECAKILYKSNKKVKKYKTVIDENGQESVVLDKENDN